MPSNYRTGLLYLEYSELSDRIEEAITEWLSNPTNLHQFDKGDNADWILAAHISAAGTDKYGAKVRLVTSGQIVLRGTLRKAHDAE